jgi:uracil-DNA glycosylase
MIDSYDSLWAEISDCEVCKQDERIELRIREGWKQTAFFPFRGVGPEPGDLPVAYLLVAQEPSTGWVKKEMSLEEARAKARDGGIRNFDVTGGDFAIRWAAHKWLVDKSKEAFLLTDLAKCSVTGNDVDDTMPRRYRNCRPFLNREVEMFLPGLRAIVPVGKAAYRWCIAAAEPKWPPITDAVPHYAWRFPKGGDKVNKTDWDEFRDFVTQRNPSRRVHDRERQILGIYKVEFARINAKYRGA